jgi:hypothetical protein
MKYGKSFKFITIKYPANSLYDLFADTKYRSTSLGRKTWKSLIAGSSMQSHCNREGFNIKTTYVNIRLGILGNNENDCASTDSFIGLGSYSNSRTFCKFVVTANSAGNVGQCWSDNGNTDFKDMAYILIR